MAPATDASRRWLDDSGIWSCRIKLPQSQTDQSRVSEDQLQTSQDMGSLEGMDVPLPSTSPSSRRNQGKIAEAIQSMSNLNNSMETLDLPTDPDAQATVTDFLDFTEYLPSDMIRSLTLIGNLDQIYSDSSINVNTFTKKYGDLPNIHGDSKPVPARLRSDISQNMSQAVTARILSHAEARRMAENVDRHYNRAKNILAKLQAMRDNYPPSREPSLVPEKGKSPVANRGPKITLRVGTSADGGAPRVRKHRVSRITVPGEVLAPYELDYESYGSETSWDSDEEFLTPRATPGATLGSGKIRLKVPKQKKEKVPKPPRGPRPPGVMGTNVHSQVAGISTSNALAKLKPPPADAVPGDENLPWLQLNAWELAHLRKRMKKNAIWSPSDTMIARELKQLGRGIENYRIARAKAEAAGESLNGTEPPQLRGETVHAEGAISVEALKNEEPQLVNRGMKLNEAKKLKKENLAKELEKGGKKPEETVQPHKAVVGLADKMKGLFNHTAGKEKESNTKSPAKTPAKKRKRESPVAEEAEKSAEGEASAKAARPPLKRNKTETPVPVPLPITFKQASPLVSADSALSASSEAAPPITPLDAPKDLLAAIANSPKKSSTPILPPGKEKKAPKKEVKTIETAANTRPRRSSGAPTPTPAPEPQSAKRPSSSRSNAANDVATATLDRPRRASTARNTPAPESRQAGKRTKRPAPGVVTASSEGSTAVSVGKRSSATRKKAGTKKDKKDGREGSVAQEIYDEVDDEGNVIDPDEPRYCLCNRVSFGTMIACENNDCEKEWFHLECIGLTEIPPRTRKWYCPECRVNLGIGEKGDINNINKGRKK